jgi:hypothetical protein
MMAEIDQCTRIEEELNQGLREFTEANSVV